MSRPSPIMRIWLALFEGRDGVPRPEQRRETIRDRRSPNYGAHPPDQRVTDGVGGPERARPRYSGRRQIDLPKVEAARQVLCGRRTLGPPGRRLQSSEASGISRAAPAHRRRGREAEGGGLLNRYRVVKLYRGFESLRLRQCLPILAMMSDTYGTCSSPVHKSVHKAAWGWD